MPGRARLGLLTGDLEDTVTGELEEVAGVQALVTSVRVPRKMGCGANSSMRASPAGSCSSATRTHPESALEAAYEGELGASSQVASSRRC